MIKFILDILRGIVIGIANVIPGVSGGTMMVSMGIYDDIIGSINNLFKSLKKSIRTLLPYAIGMAIGIVGFAFAIEFLFDKFPIPTALLFIGLIFGSVPIIFKKVKVKIDWVSVMLFIAFFALVILLDVFGKRSGITKELTFTPGGVIVSVVVGIVAAATMIIPGVSGSMVMMILGYYNSIIGHITSFITALKNLDFKTMLGDVGVLFPFGVGVLFGIFFAAKLIEFLLEKYESKTYAGILGLILASPYPVITGSGVESVSAGAVVCGILTFAVGFIVAFKLGKEE